MRRLLITALGFGLVATSCMTAGRGPAEARPANATSGTVLTTTSMAAVPTTTVAPTTTAIPVTPTTISPFARPDWLGTRVLPLGPDGENGIVLPTPPELEGRAFETVSLLSPPSSPGVFEATIQPIPPDILPRTSWTEECPVTVDELRYLTMSIYGFDGDYHTGEMIVNATIAEDIVSVFRQLHDARFPIEDMVVTTAEEIEDPPTGDGNRTASFECRPAVGSNTWSQHAYGLAVDINRFHNPYLKGELVLPELSSYYLDRTLAEPGMIVEGDVVVHAFSDLGWGWGGRWNSLKDWMHFSQNGR